MSTSPRAPQAITPKSLLTRNFLKYAKSPTVYYLTNGLIRPFASEESFKANHFNFKSVITVSDGVKYLVGNPILGFERGLSDVPAK